MIINSVLPPVCIQSVVNNQWYIVTTDSKLGWVKVDRKYEWEELNKMWHKKTYDTKKVESKRIKATYKVDGSKCISYFTIELKNEIPSSVSGQFDDWMFGCDVCQDVCPWNRFSKAHKEPLFDPHPDVLSNSKKDWEEITKEVFSEIFKKSPLKRTKFEGLRRNIEFLKP